ncbi:MAG: alpha/beta hydrolase [Alphaproteobacteria bacterium]
MKWVYSALTLGLALTVGAFALSACQTSLIYHPHSEIVQPDIAGVSVEHIRTSDGQTLVAWYAAPPHGGPIFLYFDGNGGAPEMWDARWRAMIGGGAGFLAVYYRGYSGSTGHPSEAGLHEDARAGYDWLIAHGYEARDIVIDGFSLGSGVAVRLASERPARALILEAPFTGVDDVAHYRAGALGALITQHFASRDYIGRVHMPVFIAHGDADQAIPFAQGERLYALANEPKEFVRMPGSSHVSLVRDGVYTHVFDFLARHPVSG